MLTLSMILTPLRGEFAWRCDGRRVAVFGREGRLWAAFLNYIELAGLEVLENLEGAAWPSSFSPAKEVL